jgi:hypothetical protein
MSKDGPPISGGFRFGGIKAMRTGLPPKATNLQAIVTDADLEARRSLSDFASYHARAKSIGKPLSATRGVSRERAAALLKSQELDQQQLNVERTFTISDNGRFKLKLGVDVANKRYRFVEEDLFEGSMRYSVLYPSKDLAILYHRFNRILWY